MSSTIPLQTHLIPWMEANGQTPHAFQREAWAAWQAGQSGLIQVPTGSGKTYAAWLAPLADWIADPTQGLHTLYITPLRALTRDVELALKRPIEALGLPMKVDNRTGDTSTAARARQKKTPPHALITTPESLCLRLTDPDAQQRLAGLRAVIVDEWHELMGTKRGALLELALARLRRWNPSLRTWGLSATLANPQEAAQSLVGLSTTPALIEAQLDRPILLDTLLPPDVMAFPWAGFTGLSMVSVLADTLDLDHSTLIFTNTRAQAERWFQAMESHRPEWSAWMALHHGSLDREERTRVETGVKSGEIRLVFCTSSLDLGVDFPEVERVVQIGSPKGIARLIQRAGRAAHRPGAPCHLSGIPTHGLELLEFAAARQAIESGQVEPRPQLTHPVDVLCQHLVTCAMGGGFQPDELFEEIRTATSYQTLPRSLFEEALLTVVQGGKALGAYPNFRKVALDPQTGHYHVPDKRIGHLHKMNIGVITADASLRVILLPGKLLGTVEERFLGKLQPGECFYFGGRLLEFVQIREMAVYTRLAKTTKGATPSWVGGQLPLSSQLADSLRQLVDQASAHTWQQSGLPPGFPPEVQAARPILAMQQRLSALPTQTQLLMETWTSREGWHLYLYPFEGRLVHEGLALLLSYRLARRQAATFVLTANDYGLELFTPDKTLAFNPLGHWHDWITDHALAEDLVAACNQAELGRRQFRGIARVAGLVIQTYPGQPKTATQLQASAGLLYDVLAKYDPEHVLLGQAQREILTDQFQLPRMAACLARLSNSDPILKPLKKPSPFSFPLMADRLSARLSTETLHQRLQRMISTAGKF